MDTLYHGYILLCCVIESDWQYVTSAPNSQLTAAVSVAGEGIGQMKDPPSQYLTEAVVDSSALGVNS